MKISSPEPAAVFDSQKYFSATATLSSYRARHKLQEFDTNNFFILSNAAAEKESRWYERADGIGSGSG